MLPSSPQKHKVHHKDTKARSVCSCLRVFVVDLRCLSMRRRVPTLMYCVATQNHCGCPPGDGIQNRHFPTRHEPRGQRRRSEAGPQSRFDLNELASCLGRNRVAGFTAIIDILSLPQILARTTLSHGLRIRAELGRSRRSHHQTRSPEPPYSASLFSLACPATSKPPSRST
jgi:hypothetical protein